MPPTDDASGAGRASRRGLQTSVVDNSFAYGFSITVTASYGVLNQLAGQPSLGRIFAFALAAAAAFTLLQGLVSGGFRRSPGTVPREVVMLGTALDVVSVGLGVGAAALVALVLPAAVAWPVAAFAAAVVFVLADSLELALAAQIQRGFGDPRAETETG